MTRNLRERTPTYGLVLANGGTMTYQHVLVLSAVAPSQPYPSKNPLPPIITDIPVPTTVEKANGEAVIEVCDPLDVLSAHTNGCLDVHRGVQPRWHTWHGPCSGQTAKWRALPGEPRGRGDSLAACGQ